MCAWLFEVKYFYKIDDSYQQAFIIFISKKQSY